MKSPIDEVQLLLIKRFGNNWRILWGSVYVTITYFDKVTSSHSNTNVYLGRLIDEELLDTIRGFGKY